MSTIDLLVKTIHNLEPLQSLESYKRELREHHTMSSPVSTHHKLLLSDTYEDKETDGELSNFQSVRTPSLVTQENLLEPDSVTPVDAQDLRRNPKNYKTVFLKELLRERGLPTSGNRSSLVERLILHA
jgi:hypothetical protein